MNDSIDVQSLQRREVSGFFMVFGEESIISNKLLLI